MKPRIYTHLLGVSVILFLALLTYQTLAQDSKDHGTTSKPTPAPGPPPDQYNCSTHTGDCSECVKNIHCYYCIKTKACGVFPWGSLRPMPKDCGDSTSDLNWKTCVVNGKVLIIVFSVLGGLIGTIILVLLGWCCCIRPCVRSCYEKQEAKWERNRLKMQEMQSQRRKERQQQRDAIRAKYGLDGPQYDKF